MNKKQKIFLASILIVGFILHLLALKHALPVRFFGDEYIHLANGLKMLNQKTLFLDFSYLPPLFAYLLMPFILLFGLIGMIFGAFQGLEGFKDYVILNSESLLVFSRLIAACFGTLSIYLVFKFAKELFGIKTAFVSAIILTVLPIHLMESQVGRFWLPVSFFILMSAYSMYFLLKTGKLKWYIWTVLMIGLGYGMGLISVVLIPWFIFVHFLATRKYQEKFLNKKFIISSIWLIVIIGFFILTNSYTFLRQFGRGLATILIFFDVAIDVPQSNPRYFESNYLQVLWSELITLWYNFYLLIIPLLYGLILLIKKKVFWKNFINYLLVIFPLVYLLGLAAVFNEIVKRYLFPIMMLLVIVAAFGIVQLASKINFKKSILGVLILPQIYFAASYNYKILKTNTYILAREWIEANIPQDSKIASNCPHFNLNSNHEALKFQQENNSIFFDTKSELLINMPKEELPSPNYFIMNLSHLKLNKITLADFTVDYLITCSYNKDSGMEKITPEMDGVLGKYNLQLLTNIYPNKENHYNMGVTSIQNDLEKSLNFLRIIERFGPRIEIYNLIKNK